MTHIQEPERELAASVIAQAWQDMCGKTAGESGNRQRRLTRLDAADFLLRRVHEEECLWRELVGAALLDRVRRKALTVAREERLPVRMR